MNEDQEMFLRFGLFTVLLMSPVMIVGPIYAYVRDLHLGRQPLLETLIAIELFSIGSTVFAYWFIKRQGWDFWRKGR